MSLSSHTHYLVWAYEEYERSTGNYLNNVVCDLLAETEEDAIKLAALKAPQRHYRLHQVVMHIDGFCR